MTPLSIFVGYDPRENDAYEVCVHSLKRHASIPLRIVQLEQSLLRYLKLYDRPYVLQKGQRIDQRDGKPFSTEFSFTRFLVPALSLYDGWSLFCDCDFLFTADIAELMEYADPKFAALVVKHDHQPKEQMKMDGVVQSAYPRKNWSSFMLLNCGHQSNKNLGVDAVNHESGSWLHGMEWLRDSEIGELPQTWNWLSGVSEPLVGGFKPKAVHYTLGVPSMAGYEDCPYSDLWFTEQTLLRQGRKSNHLRAIA